jgi:predicted transcriptional regulator
MKDDVWQLTVRSSDESICVSGDEATLREAMEDGWPRGCAEKVRAGPAAGVEPVRGEGGVHGELEPVPGGGGGGGEGGVRMREHLRRPARRTKWGRAALATGYEPPDRKGKAVMRRLRRGLTQDRIAEELGVSVEMVRQLCKRLVGRAKATASLASGLQELAREREFASRVLTKPQFEAIGMLLTGMTQCDAAEQLGVTQAAVASRLMYARAKLKALAPALKALRKAVGTLGKFKNPHGFQPRPPK